MIERKQTARLHLSLDSFRQGLEVTSQISVHLRRSGTQGTDRVFVCSDLALCYAVFDRINLVLSSSTCCLGRLIHICLMCYMWGFLYGWPLHFRLPYDWRTCLL